MQDLRTLFEGEYPGKERLFEALIKPIFLKATDTSLTDKQVLVDSDRGQIKSCRIIAQVRGGFPIIFADVELQDTVDLKRSRVNIQNCVRRIMENNTNAIIFFHFTDNAKEWRVSYVHRAGTNGNSTSAKRHTYLCGPEHSCRTVSERFETLKGLATIKDEDMAEAFSVEALTEDFYRELFKWYTWACENVTFPAGDTSTDSKGKRNVRQTNESSELNLIRLITRLMFVWFIKQKDLIPSWIFDQKELGTILADFDPKSKKDGNYYNAVLQNLFFATLNKKIDERAFADDKKVSHNNQFGVKNLYRDNKQKSFFKKSNKEIIDLFKPVPFLNGGLFECLDKLKDGKDGKDGKKNIQEFTDGFTREPDWMAHVPNMLFWQEDDGEHEGLIHILNRYNFTVDENSPTDVQVALDPELLGKVFENLLGTYNPETSETARKSSGSFYTPRQIVSFMVDEAIKAYLSKAVKSISAEKLETLFDDGIDDFDAANKEEIVSALKKLKILDPACGSGAFPMGALQRLVHLIEKCGGVADDRASLYALKLSLIENCLYGVDIQPIAVQICKLRFFISLICEQERTDSIQDNYGFNPLPNLETKFVAANSLIGISKRKEYETGELFANPEIALTKGKLQKERHNHFNAPSAEAKAECRKNDKLLREKLSKLLQEDNMYDNREAKLLAGWNPYDQNTASGFFDAEWMFNVSGGFDIVIGNPPYVQIKKGFVSKEQYPYAEGKDVGKQNLYKLFVEASYNFLKENGVSALIVQSSLMCDMSSSYTRELLFTKTRMLKVIEFPKSAPTKETQIFKSVLQGTCVVLFIKQKPDAEHEMLISINNDVSTISSLEFELANQHDLKTYFSSRFEIPLIRKGEMEIVSKVKRFPMLQKNIDDSLQGNINTIHLPKIKSDKPTDIFIAKGANVHKYYLDDDMFFGKKSAQVKELVARNHDAGAVIVTQNITGTTDKFRIHAAYAECKNTSIVFLHSVNILYLPNPSLAKFILAMLNSKLLDWLFRKTSTNNHCNMYELVDLPIPPATAAQQKPVIALVDKILAQKSKALREDTSALEAQIDGLVYALYGLTPEEIAVVEGR